MNSTAKVVDKSMSVNTDTHTKASFTTFIYSVQSFVMDMIVKTR